MRHTVILLVLFIVAMSTPAFGASGLEGKFVNGYAPTFKEKLLTR
jgi:hypothetical protein